MDRALPGSATVVGVRSGHNVAVGVAFDRLVIEFADQVPGYDMRYVPDVRSPNGLGVDDRVGFRVLELSNPPRLAIDLAA
ncbi:hypothetical protein [Parafrankia sp. FMc2]|uniref:hypothetical protein n=1 Tax=Parafrankia sp. FMc2 TaxID=3233196 RepID=UPI0034D5B068